jgi:ADP-ribose pyrophosphatase YjhB (NUDIX family)
MRLPGFFTEGAYRLFMTARAVWSPAVMGVSGAVFDAQGRVLLVRQSYNAGWRLPGGGIERGEPPRDAVLRELAEEVGLSGGTAVFFGLYVRKAGWATSVIALYRIDGGLVNFRPNLEIREICYAHPGAPPEGATRATHKRLKELTGGTVSPTW